MLSLIITLQRFMVFSFAAVTKMEKATPPRFYGLFTGLVGVSPVLYTRSEVADRAPNAWLLFAMLLPLLFVVKAIMLAGKRPDHVDLFASISLMMAISTLLLLPWAYMMGDFMPLEFRSGKLEFLMVLTGLVAACSLLLACHLMATAVRSGPAPVSSNDDACGQRDASPEMPMKIASRGMQATQAPSI